MRVRVRGGQRERGVGRKHGHGRGQRRGPVRRRVSNDIRATLVDHVINHGLSMREAGQRVHPNLSRYTVASILRTFRLENRYIFKFLLLYLLYVSHDSVSYYSITLQYYSKMSSAVKYMSPVMSTRSCGQIRTEGGIHKTPQAPTTHIHAHTNTKQVCFSPK